MEAARAGEQGCGFAVVAGEIRHSASRSAEAAKEIRTLISDSQTQVGEGSELAQQNAALVQQSSAATRSLEEQSHVLLEAVAMFKLQTA